MGFDDDSNESIAERASEAVEQGGDPIACLDCDEVLGLTDVVGEVSDDGGEG